MSRTYNDNKAIESRMCDGCKERGGIYSLGSAVFCEGCVDGYRPEGLDDADGDEREPLNFDAAERDAWRL